MDLESSAPDVLAQPTRARLFRLLRELGRPTTTEELAADLGLRRSGVRVHLERLERAGLVDRHRARQPRGRPRDAWSVSPRAQAQEQRPEAYAELAAWLAAAIPARPGRLREVQAAGRQLGHRLSEGGAEIAPEEGIGALFAALRFQPGLVRTPREPSASSCATAPTARLSEPTSPSCAPCTAV